MQYSNTLLCEELKLFMVVPRVAPMAREGGGGGRGVMASERGPKK